MVSKKNKIGISFSFTLIMDFLMCKIPFFMLYIFISLIFLCYACCNEICHGVSLVHFLSFRFSVIFSALISGYLISRLIQFFVLLRCNLDVMSRGWVVGVNPFNKIQFPWQIFGIIVDERGGRYKNFEFQIFT